MKKRELTFGDTIVSHILDSADYARKIRERDGRKTTPTKIDARQALAMGSPVTEHGAEVALAHEFVCLGYDPESALALAAEGIEAGMSA
jgi:hypothetical protein